MLRYAQVRASVRVRCAHFKRTLYWHWQIIQNRWYVVPVPMYRQVCTVKNRYWGTFETYNLPTFVLLLTKVRLKFWPSTSMPFASIHQFSCWWFHESLVKNKSLFTNLQIHQVLGFHPNENQVQKMGWHGWGSTYMISTLISNKKVYFYEYTIQSM